MEKIFTDNLGKVLTLGGKALRVTSSIDSNIIPGNIKSGAIILGVTGNYEGGSGVTTFYTGSSTIPGAKGPGGNTPIPEPGTTITFYVSYPNNGDKIPDMFIVYDQNKSFTNQNLYYAILSSTQRLNDTDYGGAIGINISITNMTSTLATLQYYNSATENASFNPSILQFAPIYLS